MAQNMHKLDKEIYIYSPIYVNKYLKTFKKIYPNLVNGTYLKKKIKYTSRLINLYNHLLSSIELNKKKFDIYHSTYFGKPLYNFKKIPLIVTVHDLIHEIFLEKKNIKGLDKKKEILNQADHIICVSKNTREDLLNFII